MFNKCCQSLLLTSSEAAILVAVVAGGNRQKSSLWSSFFHQEWALFPCQLPRPEKHVPLKSHGHTQKLSRQTALEPLSKGPVSLPGVLMHPCQDSSLSAACTPFIWLLLHPLNRTPFPTLPSGGPLLTFEDSDQTPAPKSLF